jgi:hypothetical protein
MKNLYLIKDFVLNRYPSEFRSSLRNHDIKQATIKSSKMRISSLLLLALLGVCLAGETLIFSDDFDRLNFDTW